MHKSFSVFVSLALSLALLTGCGAAAVSGANPAAGSAPAGTAGTEAAAPAASLPDGVYSADFETDSSMFAVNEACGGKGTLTVQDGKMTIHVSLVSKKILNLYPGTAADAGKAGAALLQPTTDTVAYSDGTSDEVYGFDVPVPALDTEFDLAIIGTKGTWYDHKVSVQNPAPQPATAEAAAPALADGDYTVAVTMAGGSGRASVQSPAALQVKDGKATATLIWSSANYDYMKVDGVRYDPLAGEEFSTFEVPVAGFDAPLTMIGDTVAMSTPHEIEYTFTFDSAGIQKAA